jgi:hypothetical protein
MLSFIKYIKEAESKDLLSQWGNEEPVEFVKSLTSKLGLPSELTENRAVWYNKDGFKRIEVKDEYVLHCCPAPHYDFVYSTIDLHVPKKFVRIFAESSESILLDLLKNEVTARCATLSANAVTLNYVLDVVSERVEGSKEEYENRIKQLYKNKLNPDPDWWPDVTNEVRKKSKVNEMKSFKEFVEHPNCGTLDCCGQCSTVSEAESWEAGYKRRVVKTTDADHKEKGMNWRIKGKERPEISIKLYKEKPSQAEFNKQMRRVAGHEFGG